jgi:hypothetical protein
MMTLLSRSGESSNSCPEVCWQRSVAGKHDRLAGLENSNAQIEPYVLFVSKHKRPDLDLKEQNSPSKKSIEVGSTYGDGAHGERSEEQSED